MKINTLPGCMLDVIWNNKYPKNQTKRIKEGIQNYIMIYTKISSKNKNLRIIRLDKIGNKNTRATCQITDISERTK